MSEDCSVTSTRDKPLNYRAAKKLLSGPLHFGDPDQIRAVRVIDAVDELKALQTESGHQKCQGCDGSGETECDKCSGSGECDHCGAECGECDGEGTVDCPVCCEMDFSEYECMTEQGARALIAQIRGEAAVAESVAA